MPQSGICCLALQQSRSAASVAECASLEGLCPLQVEANAISTNRQQGKGVLKSPLDTMISCMRMQNGNLSSHVEAAFVNVSTWH